MKDDWTLHLEAAAARAASARQDLEDAIYEARASGMPLRTIAKAVGLSPEWVRRISTQDASGKPPPPEDASN